jgi:hypothetical protein
MPYKSEAQRRLLHHLVAQGKLAPEAVKEYDRESKGKKMPEYVKHKKAFGGEVKAKKDIHCPACDYPLDSVPVAMDAGEGCPRCGYGSAKDVPQRAHGGMVHHGMPKSHSGKGGEVMDSTAYRARGGVMQPHGGGAGLATAAMAVARGGNVPGYAKGGECHKCGYAHGGEVMHCARCGSMMAMGGEVGDGLHGDMKEMYPSKKDRGGRLDDGKIHGFAMALRRSRGK